MSFLKRMSHALSQAPDEILREARERTLLLPTQEALYRDVFVRDLQRLGITDEFYPFHWAANHGLLYVITRIFQELPVTRVLEFGAGQTTILLDRLIKRCRPMAEIVTVEHDREWAESIGGKTGRPILVAALTGTGTRHGVGFYDPARLPAGAFDLMIVDGPPAHAYTNRLGRNGFADIFLERISPDFILIIDDAERSGERKLVRMVRDRLREAGRQFGESDIVALKRQKLFCGGAFRSAAYY